MLWAILLLALALRAWGLGYGLPNVYNPDEVSILSRALSLAGKGLDPGNFVYPSLFFYVLAAAMGGTYAVERVLGRVDSPAAFERAYWQDPTLPYLVARSISVAAGVLCVAAVYALACKIAGRAVARTAAFLMAVAYIPVRDAHMIKHDVPIALASALVVLACWRIQERGRTGDYVKAGLLAGVSFAAHYYAVFTIVPIAVSHAIRTGLANAIRESRGLWMAGGVMLLTFAVLSPYVLIDHTRAFADIVANRQILFDRTKAEMEWWGPAVTQLRLMATMGAGAAMMAAAVAGAWLLIRKSWQHAAWLLAMPVVFAAMLTRSYPFGRTQNVLYPFIAVLAAIALERLARTSARPAPVLIGLAIACGAQPLFYDVVLDRLMTRTDTRTAAAQWLAEHVPAGSGVAVEVYSVPLEPTRDWLQETIARLAPGEPLGPRARGLLARDPYPTAGYRLFYLGTGGMDKDKAYLDPDQVFAPGGFAVLRRSGVSHVVIKEAVPHEADAMRTALKAGATMVYRASPFAEGADGEAQLPDYDVRPSLDTTRPGPTIEVWRLTGSGDGR